MSRINKLKNNSLARQGFHIMAKPVGALCNLNCTYCFYLEKKAFYSNKNNSFMANDVLDKFIKEYIKIQPGDNILFDWQGGEPTLAGIDFFKRVIKLQKKYNNEKIIQNTIQTNGTLLNDEWCNFFAKNKFLVGLSIDGPEMIHNKYRLNNNNKLTFASVIHSLKLLQKYNIDFNVLATINKESSQHPAVEIYKFFKEQGVRYIQFIPIVEREANTESKEIGITLSVPLLDFDENYNVTEWSVEPAQYGKFLIAVFDEWIKNDIGEIFIMNFEWLLGAWAGLSPAMCYITPNCGQNLILEHNGDVFSCDHFMYPPYRLGNILQNDLEKMVFSKKQIKFGMNKEKNLPNFCKQCEYLSVCWGGCPKHRFLKTPDDEFGLNYLCSGFMEFYTHIAPAMSKMVDLYKMGIPINKIKKGF